jgi:hypothetical protein
MSNEQAKYEDQFTAFVDLLGFSEASANPDEALRLKVLELLSKISSLRSEFSVETTNNPDGSSSHKITPAISTFSDHIVISYALQRLYEGRLSERSGGLFLTYQFQRLVSAIAAAALPIGLLVRGGATIGKLFHGQGIVFGEAMVEAFQIEDRIATYPRVVLSRRITERPDWMLNNPFVRKDDDGLYYMDYLQLMFLNSALPGDNWAAGVKAWFCTVVPIVERNLKALEAEGKLSELAKWTWFARKFCEGLQRLPPGTLEDIGVSLSDIPWK